MERSNLLQKLAYGARPSHEVGAGQERGGGSRALHSGSCISLYILQCTEIPLPPLQAMRDTEMMQGSNPVWRIGDGGIIFDDLILILLVHVSLSSWQVVLCLNRAL